MRALKEAPADPEVFDLNADFDVEDFFAAPLSSEEEGRAQEHQNLIVSLQDESEKTVATFVSKVSADTFATGATMTQGLLSSLGNFIGACGAFCFHGVSGAASGLGAVGHGAHGLGSLGSGLSVDDHGNFHLSGSLDSLSRSTGLSRHDLLSGKYSAEGIMAAFMDCFGKGVNVFGFQLVETLFEALIPTPRPA